jgi:hypothetical protein
LRAQEPRTHLFGTSLSRALADGASAGDDPDDVIGPDDSGPRLSVTLKESSVDEFYALPATQAEQTSGRCSDTGDQSKAPQLSLGAPAATAGTPAARFTRSRGTPYDATQSCRFHVVRATRTATVASGDGRPA